MCGQSNGQNMYFQCIFCPKLKVKVSKIILKWKLLTDQCIIFVGCFMGQKEWIYS